MKAIGYIRVSTEDQAENGVSLDAQKGKIAAWCELNDYELIETACDAGLSGSRADNRPELKRALALACEHKAALVVYSLSRLARSTADTMWISQLLNKSGADLVSVSERIDTTTAAGKMVFRMLAVMAEFERDQIAERTKAAMAHMRKQNKRISLKIPYGYTLAENGKDLLINHNEMRVIEKMKKLKESGLSLRKIGAHLEELGYMSQSGKPWQPTTISQILKREAKAA